MSCRAEEELRVTKEEALTLTSVSMEGCATLFCALPLYFLP